MQSTIFCRYQLSVSVSKTEIAHITLVSLSIRDFLDQAQIVHSPLIHVKKHPRREFHMQKAQQGSIMSTVSKNACLSVLQCPQVNCESLMNGSLCAESSMQTGSLVICNCNHMGFQTFWKHLWVKTSVCLGLLGV